MTSSRRFAVLAIGTEITTGQITNRNASWLSEQLTNLGGEVVAHVTVADDREKIVAALDWLAPQVAGILVTGGLGPTSDDFTREVIAKYVQRSLHYHEESWQRIQARLGGLGVPVAASNKQQCYFPDGATIYPNERGTADGFRVENADITLWVLPGPPIELAGLWEKFLCQEMQMRLPRGASEKLFTWGCIGKSEAALGEIVEDIVKGSDAKTGYRAHQPYVEVKIWLSEPLTPADKVLYEKLETALKPWTVARMGEDFANSLAEYVQGEASLVILDGATDGVLGERLQELSKFRRQKNLAMSYFQMLAVDQTAWQQAVKEQQAKASQALLLSVAPFQVEKGWEVMLAHRGKAVTVLIPSPYTGNKALMQTRGRYIACELALKQWCEWLRLSVGKVSRS